MQNSNKNGFTLLELAIVLAIIGLIAAGVTAGASLVNAAERRAVLSSVAQYISAIDSFEQKYEALPGDMYNAIDIWGAAHATPSTCETTASTSKVTCNGNGDNKIGDTGEEYEMFRAWQQLANANYIEGRYTGTSTSTSDPDRAATKGSAANVPLGSIDNAGFTLRWVGTTLSPYFSGNDYGHALIFGRPNTNTITDAPIFTPEEAWVMDDKSDDGMPGTGNIRTYEDSNQADCTTSDTPATAEYDTTLLETTCNMVFITGF